MLFVIYSKFLFTSTVANAALRGENLETQAHIWQWVSWADSELLPASCAWVFPYLGIMQFNKQVRNTSSFVDFVLVLVNSKKYTIYLQKSVP